MIQINNKTKRAISVGGIILIPGVNDLDLTQKQFDKLWADRQFRKLVPRVVTVRGAVFGKKHL